MGVNEFTYLLWEHDKTEPTMRYWPALIEFIGGDPSPPPINWHERLKAKRRSLGLTVAAAADLADVDEGTYSRWERGLIRPHVAKGKLKRYLS